MRIIAQYEKLGELKFVSHLDTLRFVQRALRRSGLPVKYSQGFNPHPILSFGPALSVGIEGEAELMDVTLAEEITESEFMEKMAPQMGKFRLKQAHRVEDAYPALMAVTVFADYAVEAELDAEYTRQQLVEKMEGAMAGPLLALKKGKGGVKEVDIRSYIEAYEADVAAGGALFTFRLKAGQDGALNPNLLLEALSAHFAGLKWYCAKRTALWARREGCLVPLWEAGNE